MMLKRAGGSFLNTSFPSRISTPLPSPFTMVHSGESVSAGSQSKALAGVTSFTKSLPAIGGADFARADGILRRKFAREAGLHGTAGAQVLRKRTSVHALDAGHFPLLEVSVEIARRAPVAGDCAQFLDDETPHVHRTALVVERVDAVVSDLRRSHRDDLPAVARIG
jgi:hypothetical protein